MINDISHELKQLLTKYPGDTKAALKEYPDINYLYALSDMRESLLEWYEFKPEGCLLQVGSDYGALTGLYSRRVSQVTVLEEQKENLEVNKLRHEHRNNIRYVQGNLESFHDTAYDYVVLVGSMTEDYKNQIQQAKHFLKPDGVLILAVCNRLGLKYQAGAQPDQVSLYREELVSLLCGDNRDQGSAVFYYPMPDYRLPMTIYSDSYLPVKGDLTHTILAYDYPKYIRFDLGKMYDQVCEAGEFPNFANSFLTIWSRHEDD